MTADYTYDRDTDQFVVTLADGTEVLRTRAPHTGRSKTFAINMVDLINRGEVQVPCKTQPVKTHTHHGK